MAISTRVVSYAVITTTGTHHFLTDHENEILKEASLDDMVPADKALIKVSTIAEILPVSDYYDKFPEKQPNTSLYQYINLPGWLEENDMAKDPGVGMSGIVKSISSVKALEQMMIGFARTGSKEHPLYKSMEQKLRNLKQKEGI